MLKFAISRLLWLIPTLLFVVLFLFMLTRFAPGDPVEVMCGPRATEDIKAFVRESFHLDEPLLIQVGYFFKNVFSGNLGVSIADREPVIKKIMRVFPYTLTLTLLAMSWTFLLALILGSLSAFYRNSTIDHVITGFTFTTISVPRFVVGLILLAVFSLKFPILPMSGVGEEGSILDQFRHMILPAIAMSLGWLGFMSRTVKAMMIEVLDRDYVKMERAFGVPTIFIWSKYALKNAALPVITQLGFATGEFLGGAVFIEIIFRRPGIGRLLAHSVTSYDYPVLQGTAFITTIMFVISNLLADLSHGVLDPRIRYR
jgi:peptide/nickel transport system permease protein